MIQKRAIKRKRTNPAERMQDIIQTLKAAWAAAINEYKRVRWLQGGWRNPDEVPF